MRPKLLTLAALAALFVGGLTFTGTADARPRGFYYGGYGGYYGPNYAYRYAAPYRYYGYRYSYPGYYYGYPQSYGYPGYYGGYGGYGGYGAPVYFGAGPGIYFRF